MPRQASFADLDYSREKRQTRRKVFLNEMEVAVPWSGLLSRIELIIPGVDGAGVNRWRWEACHASTACRTVTDVLLMMFRGHIYRRQKPLTYQFYQLD